MQLVEKLESGKYPKCPQGMVRIKIMKFVMQFSPGDVVDCKEEDAKGLLMVTEHYDGSKYVSHVRAMLLENAEKLAAEKLDPKNISSMSAGEMDALGMKNIVPTPRDEAFEKNLKLAKESSDKAAKERAAMAKAKSDAAKNHEDELHEAGA